LNKKVKDLARKSALSYKAKDQSILIVEDFTFDMPKTKDFVTLTNNLKIADNKSLFVLGEANKNVYLSARNLSRTKVVTVSELNTYKVLDSKSLVLTESAVAGIESILNA
jgi:large subunit ribosomal protein L4